MQHTVCVFPFKAWCKVHFIWNILFFKSSSLILPLNLVFYFTGIQILVHVDNLQNPLRLKEVVFKHAYVLMD